MFFTENIVPSESAHIIPHIMLKDHRLCENSTFTATKIKFCPLQTLVLISMFSILISVYNKDDYMSVITKKDKS